MISNDISTRTQVSVVMNVYNKEKFVREAVQSILDQTLSDMQVIIVDDCSTDRSVDIINSFNDSRISLLKLSKRLGPTASRNYAIKEAAGNFVAILDADDYAHPDRFQRQLDFMRKHPEVGLVGSNVQIINENGNHLWKSDFPLNHEQIVRALDKFINPFCHSSIFFRRYLLDQIGYYNELFRGEDFEFYLRIYPKWKMINIADVLTFYRLYPDSNSLIDVRFHGESYLALVAKKIEILTGINPIDTEKRDLFIHYMMEEFNRKYSIRRLRANWYYSFAKSNYYCGSFFKCAEYIAKALINSPGLLIEKIFYHVSKKLNIPYRSPSDFLSLPSLEGIKGKGEK